jgi:hypothetical protein
MGYNSIRGTIYIYAKNTSNVASGFSYIFATGNFGTFPVTPCCGNPVTYHIWNAVNFLDDVGPVGRNTAGGFHYSSANAQIPAGGTKWLMSVHVVAPTNTVSLQTPFLCLPKEVEEEAGVAAVGDFHFHGPILVS